MATYYRWRKSTIAYTETDTDLHATSSNPYTIMYISDDSSDIADLQFSNEISINNGVVSLVSPVKQSLPMGRSREYGYHYARAVADPQNRIFKSSVQNPYRIWFWTNRPNSGNDFYLQVFDNGTSGNTVYLVSATANPGTAQGYVYSTSSSAYPNGGVQDGYYYDQRTTVTSPTAPTGLTYPNPITTPTVTVSWNASTSNVPDVPIKTYYLTAEYFTSGNKISENINVGNATQYQYNIVPGTTSITFQVWAIDNNNQPSAHTVGSTVPVYLAPTLTVPQMVMQGQGVPINWTAIQGASSYTLQRKANTDTDWVQVYSGADTSFSEIAGTWTSVQYRVQAVFDGTGGGWAESVSIPVISASALVISGSDSDLGTLVNDIQYTISTDTGNQITAKVTVNSAVIFSGNVTSGAASTISIFDLVNGTGTIVIEASVQASSGVVNATRTWTYTKAALTFPDAGSIAQLLQKGKNIFPKTLAECVRTSDIWGGDLSSALQKLVNAVICDPETGSLGSMGGSAPTIPMFEFGSYRGTGSYSSAHMNTLTFSFKPLILFVFPELPYDRSGSLDAWWFIALNGMTLTQSAHYARGEPDTYFVNLTWNDNSVSWYSTGSSKDQLNSTETYYYAAIGLPGGDTE